MAYLRRKDWEYQFMANHIVASLGGALGQAKKMGAREVRGRGGDYVPAGQLLMEMGVKID